MRMSDNHVHSQFSWDSPEADMEAACERALEHRLTGICFTDHADFVDWHLDERTAPAEVLRVISGLDRPAEYDGDSYRQKLDNCRDRFSGQLIVLSGVELGEPHLFPERAGMFVAKHAPDVVLGSLHSVHIEGGLEFVSAAIQEHDPVGITRSYLEGMGHLVQQSELFTVLAHADYPVRSWDRINRPFDETLFEDEYREVLSALARSDKVLELNGSRPASSSWLARWWREEGGRRISFGSDAHRPADVARNFPRLVAAARAAGFGPIPDEPLFWSLLT